MNLKLMHHQVGAVATAAKHDRYAFFWDCGTGKTIAMLAVCQAYPLKTLVICPKSIMRTAWLRDAEHFPSLKAVVAWDRVKAKRHQLLRSKADVVITNFDTFRREFDTIKNAGFERLIVDESSALKNPQAKLSKCAADFADRMLSVYLLSGTPAPNNETEYFQQYRVLDPSVFGKMYYRFCNYYFTEQVKKYGDQTYHAGWKMRKDREAQFTQKLKRLSWSMTKEEAIDLPKQTDVIRSVELSAAEKRQYKSMLKELEVEIAGERRITNANAKTMKLRQITGGNYYDSGDVLRFGNSKLDELMAVLDEIGHQKTVIWAEFTADIERIEKEIQGRAADCVRLDGSTKDVAACVDEFQRGNVQYAICQPQSAGHGITLTAASYAIYYSYSFSYEHHKQSRDRIHRAGQTRPCTYFYLVADGTIDQHILDVLQKKKDSHEAIMEMLGRTATDGRIKQTS